MVTIRLYLCNRIHQSTIANNVSPCANYPSTAAFKKCSSRSASCLLLSWFNIFDGKLKEVLIIDTKCSVAALK